MSNLEEPDWSCLPEELLSLIKSKFTLIDDVNKFSAVCKDWHRAFYPKDHIGFVSEWLVRKDIDKSNFELLHPLANGESYVHVSDHDLCNTTIHHTRDGWLLMSREWNEMFFYNPFSKSTIQLPKLPENEGRFYDFTFTSIPTAKDYFVFVIAPRTKTSVDILTISKGKSDWIKTTCNHDVEMELCRINPVFHKGKFYCLSMLGQLGVFDPEDQSWIVIDLKPLNVPYNEGYLLEHDGDLTSLFIDRNLRIIILKFDYCLHTWRVIEDLDLGDFMFFLSTKASFAKKAKRDYMRNKIYLPMEYKGYGMFYSLDDKLYHTFGNDLSMKILCRDKITRFKGHCWMEPNNYQCSNERV